MITGVSQVSVPARTCRAAASSTHSLNADATGTTSSPPELATTSHAPSVTSKMVYAARGASPETSIAAARWGMPAGPDETGVVVDAPWHPVSTSNRASRQTSTPVRAGVRARASAGSRTAAVVILSERARRGPTGRASRSGVTPSTVVDESQTVNYG